MAGRARLTEPGSVLGVSIDMMWKERDGKRRRDKRLTGANP
jgi:hypothetical protein